ncbi:MAG: protein kinase [Polyangiaceae bacterium]
MPRTDERLPDAIAGFRVVRRLATGGTSDVLLARASGPNGFERTVVLKLLLAEYKDDPSFERMFAMEAAAYARLSHPSIVKLYDFFATGDQLVMVLEHVDGLPLNALRAELTNAGEVLEDRAVFYLMSRVFAALSAAHSARDPETQEFAPVVHRDVNPSNVLVHKDGSVKLADFGIAKVTGMAGDTKTGFIKGTFGYMSPEQVRGEQVTVRADVYAATLLLWELLARRRAIQHGALSDLEALRAMAHPNIVSLDVLRGDLSPELRKMIARGLEPVADNRGVTAAELSAALEEAGPVEEGRKRLVAALEKVRAPDDSVLAKTTPSAPSLEESMAMLAEADEDVPPLPSYSVPAPPMSDFDLADTKINTDAHGPPTTRGLAPGSAPGLALSLAPRHAPSVPDDLPTKPAQSSEIAKALSADDSLELARFPMPSISDAPPQLPDATLESKAPARIIESKPAPKSDPKQHELDAATDAPPSSRRAGGAPRLGSSIPPRPVIPRPMSVAPAGPSEPAPISSPVPSSKKPHGMPELKAPSAKTESLRPKTIMGGFSASSPPPPTTSAGSPPLPTNTSSPPPVRTAPMAIVPSALQDSHSASSSALSRTLAMPNAPGPMAAAPMTSSSSPPPQLPILAAQPYVGSGSGLLRNAMPTAPASFAPLPSSHQIEAKASAGTLRTGWIIAAVFGFALTAVALGLVFHFGNRSPVTLEHTKIVATDSTAATSSAAATPASVTVSATAAATQTSTAATASASATAAPTATATAAPTTTAPTSTATAAAAAIPANSAALVAGKDARQHRVFVDGKPVGEGPGTYFVPCGAHTVKIGSSGKPREVDVACGTSLNVP